MVKSLGSGQNEQWPPKSEHDSRCQYNHCSIEEIPKKRVLGSVEVVQVVTGGTRLIAIAVCVSMLDPAPTGPKTVFPWCLKVA